MKKIKVNLKKRSYSICIGKNIAPTLDKQLKNLGLGNYAVVITNKTIYSVYKKLIPKIFPKSKNLEFKFHILPDTERIKSFEYVSKIINSTSLLSYKKRVFFICWGGGVVGDLGGFIASIYKRGCPVVQIPTTLLSQIDSSIGGKTAIDLKVAKNMVGSFWQPSLVLIDTLFLKTLKTSQIRQGLAEGIKYALIKDKKLFTFLEKNCRNLLGKDENALAGLVCRCAKIKTEVVEKDEREEKGIRTILNFGHTIGHAIEASSDYKTPHGNAVALGIIAALYISEKEGFLAKAKIIPKVTALIKNAGLPVKIALDKKRIITALKKDKKFIRGKTRLVLIRDIGKVSVKEDIKISSIAKGLSLLTL
ncbi:MAG: 3-dehydroquinate synthase [Candidatus Omnitrophica bacterium]|nr:3-dehydroquinate synthase [Candidatus Omnitrophota bacterium]